MRPDKRCASHVSLSPRVTAPVGKARCGEGEGQDMCGWYYVGGCLEQRRRRCLAALSRSPDCLTAGHVSPLKFVASRRVASLFVCHPFANSFLFLHRFWQQHFAFSSGFFCFCPETQMDIAICVIRAVPPLESHLNPLCVPPKEQAGACFSVRCFSLHLFLCFCHVLSTIVANTRRIRGLILI